MSDSSTSVPQPSDTRDDPGLTRLIYGAMPLGGSWDAEDPLSDEQTEISCAALDAAEEAGYRDLDLADIYSAGKSETVVGHWLAQDPSRRQRMRVQTKAGIRIPGATADGSAPMHYRLETAPLQEVVDYARRLDGVAPASDSATPAAASSLAGAPTPAPPVGAHRLDALDLEVRRTVRERAGEARHTAAGDDTEETA